MKPCAEERMTRRAPLFLRCPSSPQFLGGVFKVVIYLGAVVVRSMARFGKRGLVEHGEKGTVDEVRASLRSTRDSGLGPSS